MTDVDEGLILGGGQENQGRLKNPA